MTLTKLYLPEMLERNSGRILNVGSTAGFMPGPLQAVYYATKAFVNSFTEAVANEISHSKVTATALCPGPTESGFAERGNLNGVAVFKLGTVPSASVAKYGYKSMLRGDRIAVHGMSNKFLVSAGLRMLPRGVTLKVSRSMMEK